MDIKQFKDEPLAHFSYALISNGEMALIDPVRNPEQYYCYAERMNVEIVAIFETHPHADFVSGHLQIHHEKGATIYVSEKVKAIYPHTPFDEGQSVKIGKTIIRPLHTPGHSPDSLTFVAEEGEEIALFTGDTLFIGDVGRPDLREKAGSMTAKRLELAKAMYETLKTKFAELPDEALVYPTHGAGSLCGKNISASSSSTLGDERIGNWAFKDQTEEEFVEEILKNQPFIPSYFGFNVDVNRKGAGNVHQKKYNVPVLKAADEIEEGITLVDIRDSGAFRKGHLPNSINIMARTNKDKYETWLGVLIKPNEPFYLVINSVEDIDMILERTAKIGYEQQIQAVVILGANQKCSSEELDLDHFRDHSEDYTIVDIRNQSEIDEGYFFINAISIPLNELRERINELPVEKPIVVHCAGGYRSTAGRCIIKNRLRAVKVFDLSESIKDFIRN